MSTFRRPRSGSFSISGTSTGEEREKRGGAGTADQPPANNSIQIHIRIILIPIFSKSRYMKIVSWGFGVLGFWGFGFRFLVLGFRL